MNVWAGGGWKVEESSRRSRENGGPAQGGTETDPARGVADEAGLKRIHISGEQQGRWTTKQQSPHKN